jgi:hypothetical protein
MAERSKACDSSESLPLLGFRVLIRVFWRGFKSHSCQLLALSAQLPMKGIDSEYCLYVHIPS